MLLTIFTPTYNRANLLPKLFESIRRQTGFTDFEWLIIDDGSTDGTEAMVAEWQSTQLNFALRYVKQPNGGKHRAMNRAAQLAEGEWFLCVDSDDLLASDTAVDQLAPMLQELTPKAEFCSLTPLRITPAGEIIGTKNLPAQLDTDFFTYRMKMHVKGDRAEVMRTSTLRQYPFPEFEGEKFLSEGCLMTKMAERYVTRFVTLPMVICEYLPGGLTDNIKRLMRENPLGVMYNCRTYFTHQGAPLLLRVQKMWQHSRAERIALANGTPIPEICQATPAMRRMGRYLLPLIRLVKRG